MPLLFLGLGGVSLTGLSLFLFGNGLQETASGVNSAVSSLGRLLALLAVLALIAFIVWKSI